MISARANSCIVMLPILLTLDSKLFRVDSMSYLAKVDISTLLKPDITTLL
jgi:hypothetical protein